MSNTTNNVGNNISLTYGPCPICLKAPCTCNLLVGGSGTFTIPATNTPIVTTTWPTTSSWYQQPEPKVAKITVLPGGTAPTPGTNKSVGYDLAISESADIGAHSVKLVKTGLIITPPDDAWIMIAARSSLHKRGLVLANGIGVVDPDFCGPEDQIRLALMNVTDQTVHVQQGDRLAQIIFMPFYKMYTWERLNLEMRAATRGGFGSTGE